MATTRFEERRRSLLSDAALRGPAFGRAYAALVDEWLAALLGAEPGVAVVAIGAYGRQALAPASDLDVALLHDGRHDVRALAERLWYPIWDARIHLDHSVRSGREAREVARQDLKSVLSLLDGRFIAGDPALAERVLTAVRDEWAASARRRLPGLDQVTQSRHRKEGDVAHLLEPDLKQAKGGLRDLRVLHALELAAPVLELPQDELEAAECTLFAVRVELHRASGRALDRLRLEEQDAVAARAGYPDAEELVRAVAGAGHTIARVADDAWRRTRSWLAGPRGRSAAGRDCPLGRGLVLRDGELDVTADADLEDPTLVVRAAAQAAGLGVPFRRGALERLASAPTPGDPWPDEARHALVSLLGTGEGLVPVFEALDAAGLLERMLPEWVTVRSKPQRNAFHRFTVDRHLLETVVQANRLTRRVSRPDLLLVGAWLHDIGKGSPGDHTDAGVELVARIAARLGFPPADRDVLIALVRHHLLLPSIATGRDLSDPATIEAVARAVERRDTLALLGALTEADSLATGDTAWSSWKAELLDVLVTRVDAYLATGGAATPASSDPSVEELRDLARRGRGQDLLVETDDRVVRVATRDAPGVLSRIVGVLALHGQSVLTAEAISEDGIAADRFRLEPRLPGTDLDRDRLTHDLRSALDGTLELDAQLAARESRYSHRPARAASPAAPVVIVHPGGSTWATVVEVRAPDAEGLLHRLTRSISALGLDIAQARAVTLGHEVVDTFYLRDAATGALVDGRAGEIERGLLDALGAPTAAR